MTTAAAPPPGVPCSVAAECEVRPSEDARTVEAALSEVIPGAPVEVDRPSPSSRSAAATAATAATAGRAEAAASGLGCLSRIAETVRSRSSRAAYLRCMLRNMEGGEDGGGGGDAAGSTWFYLNKQAAAAGRIALCAEADESPLGPIRVTIRSPDIGAVIDWLAPGQLNKIKAARAKISPAS